MKSFFGNIRGGLVWVGEKIALVTTPIFLTLFYFTVIAVAGVVATLVRADLLHRRTMGNPTSWFTREKEAVTEARYRAQF